MTRPPTEGGLLLVVRLGFGLLLLDRLLLHRNAGGRRRSLVRPLVTSRGSRSPWQS